MQHAEDDSTWFNDVVITPEKVGMLRFGALTPGEREAMRRRFAEFVGHDTIPSSPPIPAEVQRVLSVLFPDTNLPTYPLQNLLEVLELPHLAKLARLPGSGEDMQALMRSVTSIADCVITKETDPGFATDVREALTLIYRGLTGDTDPMLPRLPPGSQVDLIIALGARGVATAARANKAAELFLNCPQPDQTRLILSGYHPYYADKFEFSGSQSSTAPREQFLPFGEAEAMAVTLVNRIPDILDRYTKGHTGRRAPQLIIDPRARNTLESVVHSLPVITEISEMLGRPIVLCFVTSPYHLRRTHAIATVQYSHFLHYTEAISKIFCVEAPTLGLEALLGLSHERHRYAVELYVRETVKLLGGRVTGEF
jgi:uncharacterized SAM-binding protein YcdF (DUF218 family)